MNYFLCLFGFWTPLDGLGQFEKVLLVNYCSFTNKTFPWSVFGENGENFINKMIYILYLKFSPFCVKM